jgi:hypothetical protein
MLIFDYPTKKALKTQIGQPLQYRETSVVGAEYQPDGTLVGCNRPHLTGHAREFFAQVDLRGGKITAVR